MRTLASAFLLTSLCLKPLTANGQSGTTIPTDFFTGIKFDAVVAGPFLSYTPIYFSGSVSDPSVTDVQFSILNNDNEIIDYCSSMTWYMVPVRDRKFRHTLFFSHEQAGDYLLQIKTIRGGPPYDSAGVFRPFTIRMGPKISPIPVGFFPDIELDSPIPVEITTGQAVRVSGTVSDRSLTMVQFGLYRENVFPMMHAAPVTDRQFNKTIFFPHKTAGVYELQVDRFAGNSQSPGSPGEAFKPIYVTKGEGKVYFPFDYFEEIKLTSPMPVVFALGRKVRVTGTVSDPSVRQIDFNFFVNKSGQNFPGSVFFTSPVTDGEFSVNIDFSPEHGHRPGDGSLDVYLWRRGNSSLGPRRFRPITLVPPPSPDFNHDGRVGFPDFVAFAGVFGSTTGDENFDSRFDLDGDGNVGFSDFLIFAMAFGQPVGN